MFALLMQGVREGHNEATGHNRNDAMKSGRYGKETTMTAAKANRIVPILMLIGTLLLTGIAPGSANAVAAKDSRDSTCVNAAHTFKDVTARTPHVNDISWLTCQNITTGYPNSTFQGMTPVYRQDMAAFLRRYAKVKGYANADKWKPTSADWKRFRDVTPRTPHAEDILWLAHTGISEGWLERDGSFTFRGMTPIVRQDMAAFLRRLTVGIKPSANRGTTRRTFSDVNSATPHAEDILWLAETGISDGYANKDGSKRFEGMTRVYRQDMAAFLHRIETNLDCTRTIPAKTHEEQKLIKDAWVETKTTPAHTEPVVIEPARTIHHEAVTHTEPEYGYVEVWVDVFPDGYTCEGDEVLNMSFEEMEKHGGSYASHIEYRWQQTGEKEVIDMEAWDEFVPAKTEEKYIPEKVETIPHEAEYKTVTAVDKAATVGACTMK